jgi:hypothetical protein
VDIIHASDKETFISVIADCILNVKESMDELKFITLNGCWKNLWPETINDIQGFHNQQNKIRNFFILACNVPGE